MARSSAARAILTGGLIAGALDITDALVFYGLRGAKPIRILQSIASGALGARAYTGGWPAATLGLLLHFSIALVAAAVYYLASRILKFMRRRAVICGVVYGLAVYMFMNLVVLPRVGMKPPSAFPPFINGVFAHTLLIGLPISLSVRRYGK